MHHNLAGKMKNENGTRVAAWGTSAKQSLRATILTKV